MLVEKKILKSIEIEVFSPLKIAVIVFFLFVNQVFILEVTNLTNCKEYFIYRQKSHLFQAVLSKNLE